MFRGQAAPRVAPQPRLPVFRISVSQMLLVFGSWSQRGKHSSRHHTFKQYPLGRKGGGESLNVLLLCQGRKPFPRPPCRKHCPPCAVCPFVPKTGWRRKTAPIGPEQTSHSTVSGTAARTHHLQIRRHRPLHQSQTQVLRGRQELWGDSLGCAANSLRGQPWCRRTAYLVRVHLHLEQAEC